MSPLSASIDELLRRPASIAYAAKGGTPERSVFLAALVAIVLGAGTFGAALATSRGGLQLLYSAVKLPLVSLITLIVVTPALAAVAMALRRPLSLAGASVLLLASAGRSALVLLALAPIVWLAFDNGVAYHRGIVVACACYGLAGFEGLRMLRLALGKDLRSIAIISFVGAVLLPAGGQTAWLLRPYVGRPSQSEVPLLRGRESSFNESVHQSLFSSVEIYR